MSAEVPQPLKQGIKARGAATPYEREWKKAEQSWQTNCAGVDEVVETLAASLHAEYPSGEEYPVARAFCWFEGSTRYSISMLIYPDPLDPHSLPGFHETTLRVFAQAWRDDEAKGIRRSTAPYHVDLQTPVRPRVLERTLEGLIVDLFDSSTALIRQTAMNASVPIEEHPLPRLPG